MPEELHKRISAPNHANLIFTSAGSWANIAQWAQGPCNWDLFLCNYSDSPHPQAGLAQYYFERAGGKFPNLHYAYRHWPEIFKSYDTVFVLDDDVLFPRRDLHCLFNYQKQYQLWLLQPAFTPKGKVSHRLTGCRSLRKLTFTNFVEVCAPLFRRDKLEEFLAVYDPELVGWGVDLWMSDFFSHTPEKIAVIHDVICENPKDNVKGGEREIEQLQSQQQRIARWQEIKADRKITEHPLQEYRTIWQSPSPANLMRAIKIYCERKYYRHFKDD